MNYFKDLIARLWWSFSPRMDQAEKYELNKMIESDLIPLQDFVSICDLLYLIDDDGYGYPCDKNGTPLSDIPVVPSQVHEYSFPNKTTHIAWYNR